MSDENTEVLEQKAQEEADESAAFEDAFDEFATGDNDDESEPSSDPARDEQGRFQAQDQAEDDSDDGTSVDESDLPEPDESSQRPVLDGDDDVAEPAATAQLEQYKAEAERWRHRYNSDLGRQNALQRKIQELELQNQALQSKAPADSGMTDSQWDELKSDFPEIAGAVESKLSAMEKAYQSKLRALESQMQPIQEASEQTYIHSQAMSLEQEFPDWRDVAKSPDFQGWVNDQPLAVRELVQSNEAADAAYLIRTFKQTQQGMSDPNEGIKRKREQQLRQAQTVPSRGGRTRSGPPEDDFEAAFDFFARK